MSIELNAPTNHVHSLHDLDALAQREDGAFGEVLF